MMDDGQGQEFTDVPPLMRMLYLKTPHVVRECHSLLHCALLTASLEALT